MADKDSEDPLEDLRYCYRQNLEIKEENGKILLGGRFWPKDAVTSFPITGSRENGSGKFYTLEEILFFLKNTKATHVNYIAKAEALKVRPVKRPDRKNIQTFISQNAADTSTKAKYSKYSKRLAKMSPERPVKKARFDQSSDDTSTGNEFSELLNNRSSLISGASPSRQKLNPAAISKNDRAVDPEELAVVQSDLQNLSRKFDSLTLFLRDTFGLTRSQLQTICEGNHNSHQYIDIVRCVRHNIFSSFGSHSHSSVHKASCYQAEKHPERGWGIAKKDLLGALTGSDSDCEARDIENRHQQVIENCLARGSPCLKQSFSLLISRMLELNKCKSSDAEMEESCNNMLEKCLNIPLEDFRNMFGSLLSAAKPVSLDDDLEKWLSVSEMELKKLLRSLMISYQSLRDIPNSSSSTMLFQFPEATMSMALNASKVTHSIVLDMYVRLGLAELRRILISLISSVENTNKNDSTDEDSGSEVQSSDNQLSSPSASTKASHLPVLKLNGSKKTQSRASSGLYQNDDSNIQPTAVVKQEEPEVELPPYPMEMDLQQPEQQPQPDVNQHPDTNQQPEQEQTNREQQQGQEQHQKQQQPIVSHQQHNQQLNQHDQPAGGSVPSASLSTPSTSVGQTLHVILHQSPQLSVKSQLPPAKNGNVKLSPSPSSSRRVLSPGSQRIGDNRIYTMFKASLGNVLVSSFKKQIQEKIQASSNNTDCN